MKIGQFDYYQGYTGSIEYDDSIYHGSIITKGKQIKYEADSLEYLEDEFHDAIDNCLRSKNEEQKR